MPNFLSYAFGESRQCGICASCLLRRMSVHSANCIEPVGTYLFEDLNVSILEDAVIKDTRSACIEPAETYLFEDLNVSTLEDAVIKDPRSACIEPAETYLFEDLNVSTLEDAVIKDTRSARKDANYFKHYAIAGVRAMSDFASLSLEDVQDESLRLIRLSRDSKPDSGYIRNQLITLVNRHKEEWSSFKQSLLSQSFLRKWAA